MIEPSVETIADLEKARRARARGLGGSLLRNKTEVSITVVGEAGEAEIKHGRLAMLAAAGWPISEIIDQPLATLAGLPCVLSGGFAPSVLNGGLGNVNPTFWGLSLGLAASFELFHLYTMLEQTRANTQLARGNEDPRFATNEPGDLGFDPLGFMPTEPGRECTPRFFSLLDT